MATWWIVAGLAGSVAQNNRSPAARSPRLMCAPAYHCSAATRGSPTPARAYAHWVSPEQSKESAPTAPHTEGFPICRTACANAARPTSVAAGATPTPGCEPEPMSAVAAAWAASRAAWAAVAWAAANCARKARSAASCSALRSASAIRTTSASAPASTPASCSSSRPTRAPAAAAARVGQLLAQEARGLAGADADVVRIADADRKAEQEAAERAFLAQLAAAQATAAQAARLAAQAAATADIGSGSQPGVGVAPAATEVGRAALAEAVRQIGKPYVWGAVGADSFDCSGLTQWAYARAGVGLPRVAAEQWYAGAHISLGDLAAGDLLFWATDPGNPATIHHGAIYAGNGQMVAAPHSGALVQLQPVYLAGYIGAVRPSAGP